MTDPVLRTFPRPRESFSASIRFRTLTTARAGQHVVHREWECQECGAVVTDTQAHRLEAHA